MEWIASANKCLACGGAGSFPISGNWREAPKNESSGEEFKGKKAEVQRHVQFEVHEVKSMMDGLQRLRNDMETMMRTWGERAKEADAWYVRQQRALALSSRCLGSLESCKSLSSATAGSPQVQRENQWSSPAKSSSGSESDRPRSRHKKSSSRGERDQRWRGRQSPPVEMNVVGTTPKHGDLDDVEDNSTSLIWC